MFFQNVHIFKNYDNINVFLSNPERSISSNPVLNTHWTYSLVGSCALSHQIHSWRSCTQRKKKIKYNRLQRIQFPFVQWQALNMVCGWRTQGTCGATALQKREYKKCGELNRMCRHNSAQQQWVMLWIWDGSLCAFTTDSSREASACIALLGVTQQQQNCYC